MRFRLFLEQSDNIYCDLCRREIKSGEELSVQGYKFCRMCDIDKTEKSREELVKFAQAIEKRKKKKDDRLPWFPPGKNRIWIPLEIKNADKLFTTEDAAVIYAIHNFKGGSKRFPYSPQGYEVVDYVQGYAKPKSVQEHVQRGLIDFYQYLKNKTNSYNILLEVNVNKIRIGAILNYLIETAPTDKEKTYYTNLLKYFEHSKYRIFMKYKWMVVISKDPHDVARLGISNYWKSCLRPGGSSYSHEVVCSGALVAYLVKQGETDLRKAIARILLDRYTPLDGSKYDIVVPQPRVYGWNVEGFYEFVKNWLEKVQSKYSSKETIYSRQGMHYSDELGDIFWPEQGAETAKRIFEKLIKGEIRDEGKLFQIYTEYFSKPRKIDEEFSEILFQLFLKIAIQNRYGEEYAVQLILRENIIDGGILGNKIGNWWKRFQANRPIVDLGQYNYHSVQDYLKSNNYPKGSLLELFEKATLDYIESIKYVIKEIKNMSPDASDNYAGELNNLVGLFNRLYYIDKYFIEKLIDNELINLAADILPVIKNIAAPAYGENIVKKYKKTLNKIKNIKENNDQEN